MLRQLSFKVGKHILELLFLVPLAEDLTLKE